MNEHIHTVEGAIGILAATLAHLWAVVYPLITGMTALGGAVLVLHGLIRLYLKWRRGQPVFSDPPPVIVNMGPPGTPPSVEMPGPHHPIKVI